METIGALAVPVMVKQKPSVCSTVLSLIKHICMHCLCDADQAVCLPPFTTEDG